MKFLNYLDQVRFCYRELGLNSIDLTDVKAGIYKRYDQTARMRNAEVGE